MDNTLRNFQVNLSKSINNTLSADGFNLDQISSNKQRYCMETMMGDDLFDFYMSWQKVQRDNTRFHMIRLAWLWANDFIEVKRGRAYPVAGIDLDLKNYTLDPKRIHLMVIMKSHKLDKLVPILRILQEKKKQKLQYD